MPPERALPRRATAIPLQPVGGGQKVRSSRRSATSRDYTRLLRHYIGSRNRRLTATVEILSIRKEPSSQTNPGNARQFFKPKESGLQRLYRKEAPSIPEHRRLGETSIAQPISRWLGTTNSVFSASSIAAFTLRFRAAYLIAPLALALLSTSCAGSGEPLSTACTPGRSSLLSSTDAEGFNVIVFGETHGNSQSPAIFLDFVCRLASTSAPVLVGIEIPPSSVDAVRDAARHGRATVFEDLFWAKSRDGRSSSANLVLVERLVRLESEGFIRLVGFDKRVTGEEAFGSSALAALTSKGLRKGTNEKWVLLTGRGHSRYEDDPSSLTYVLVNSGRSTKVVDLSFATGTTWACVMGECKVRQTGNRECETSLKPAEVVSGTRFQITHRCIDSATASAPAADSARDIDR